MFLFCTPCKKTLDLKILTSENRWAKVTSTPCLQGNCLKTYRENIHNGVEWYSLSENTQFIFIAFLMKLLKFSKSAIPPKRLRIVASVS